MIDVNAGPAAAARDVGQANAAVSKNIRAASSSRKTTAMSAREHRRARRSPPITEAAARVGARPADPAANMRAPASSPRR
ncbi:MAG: hypothetical protein MZV49_17555 [Rhodopseudomonas palustris]|nr:hypothetical protein [Rhodopseudomonas palustris]